MPGSLTVQENALLANIRGFQTDNVAGGYRNPLHPLIPFVIQGVPNDGNVTVMTSRRRTRMAPARHLVEDPA